MTTNKKYKKKKNPPKTQKSKKAKTTKLLILITLIYFLTVFGLILCVHESQGDTSEELLTSWIQLIYFTYYFMPFVLAGVFGWFFRPFWPNFRNLAFTIFFIHGIYSLAVYTHRLSHLTKWGATLLESQKGELQVNFFTHKLFDEDNDGLVDRIVFNGEFDISLLGDGRYTMDVFVSQRGWILTDGTVGTYTFIVNNDEKSKVISRSIQTTNQGQVETFEYVSKGIEQIKTDERGSFRRSFHMNPQRFKQYYPRGPFDVNILLKKEVFVSDETKGMIYYSRWAPFLRTVSWSGIDPNIQDEIIEVNALNGIDSFSLVPSKFKQQEVFFQAYLGDDAKDTDDNGLYDELSISMELYSNYEGPIFLSGYIDGAPQYQFRHQTSLEKGFNKVNFVLDGQAIYQLGFDAPFIVFDIILTNNDPDCEGAACHTTDRAFFTEYLDDYVTGYYSFEEFE